MKDRDEIIKHLCFVYTWATVNPKYGMGLTIEECLSAEEWINDAIDFLRAQQPRVMTIYDIENIGPDDVCAFVEVRDESHIYACYMRQYDETHTEIMCDVPNLPVKLQEGCVRIWTSRPDEKVRAETPWQPQ